MAAATSKSTEQSTNATSNVEEKEMENLISIYSKLRKLKYENKLVEDIRMNQTKDNIVRVMSYNILADGPNYALGKWVDYCPYGKDGDRLAFRRWSYRGPRILAQIQCYKPDIICMQETTQHTFTSFFEPKLKALGYHGIHGIRDTIAASKGNVNVMTDSLFYNTQKFQLKDHKILRLAQIVQENKNGKYTKYFDFAGNYPFLTKLRSRPDICMVAFLQFKKTQKPFIAVNSHLFWDGTFAHTKTSQCLVINHELYDLMAHEWKLNVNEVPIVFGTDANSNAFRSQFDVLYDENNPTHSGVYQLMTTSKIKKEHIDHPFTRCKIVFDENNDTDVKNDNDASDASEKKFMVNLRGLPYSARDEEIKQFFKDEKIKNIDIILQHGRPSGSGNVEFEDAISLNSALKKHKQYIGSRYIEVTELSAKPRAVVQRDSNTNVSNDKERFVVKMFGLPWVAREKEVRDFFKDENVLEVLIVLFKNGRASGEGFVEFKDKKSLASGMKKNKEYMGARYVELVVSDGFELDVAAGRAEKEYVNPDIDDWNIDIQWQSAYKAACGKEPFITTKTPDYWGVTDYIFIGVKCKARSYLELPYHDDTLPSHQQRATQFPNFPNQVDPSDHIPIVCDVEVL